MRAEAKEIVAGIVAEEGLELLGWRLTPTDPIGSGVGQMALDVMPAFEQLFLAAPARADGSAPFGVDLDRAIYPARKRIEHETAAVAGDEARCLLRVAVQPDPGLQGHADHRATAGVLR